MEGGKVKCQARGMQHPLVVRSSGLQGQQMPRQITSCETRVQLLNLYELFIRKIIDIFLMGYGKD